MKAFLSKNFLPLIAGLLLLGVLAAWGISTASRSVELSGQQEQSAALQSTLTQEHKALNTSRSTLTKAISGLNLSRKTVDDGSAVASLGDTTEFVPGSFVSHVTEIKGDTYQYFASVQLPDQSYLALVYTSDPSGSLTEVSRYHSDGSTLFSSK